MERSARPVLRETVPVQPEDTKSGFRCGQRALDDFFARHALENDRNGIGKTYVLRGDPAKAREPAILGFYTLSMANVEADTLDQVVKARLPRYPIPVALLGRLAVHRDAQRRGVGAWLLRDALLRVLDVADQIGCLGVIVDAKDEPAERFYRMYGFVSLTTGAWPRRLFLPLTTVRDAAAVRRRKRQ